MQVWLEERASLTSSTDVSPVLSGIWRAAKSAGERAAMKAVVLVVHWVERTAGMRAGLLVPVGAVGMVDSMGGWSVSNWAVVSVAMLDKTAVVTKACLKVAWRVVAMVGW